MEQLYYTSCVTGKSVSGNSGFQVRAVSPGLTADKMRAVMRYVSYLLPSGTPPDDDTALTAPVRLALLDTPDAGRILCHSVYVGKDPMTGRWGNFFTHLLQDVPAELSAAQAIGTWGSDFWRRADNEHGIELQRVHDIPSEQLLNDQELAEFMADDSCAGLVRFVITAVLSTRPDQRIIVAAPNSAIAGCVYALTHVLPQSLLKDFTFSTYESEPLTCSARLIGTTWKNPEGKELPSSCYAGSSVGYNTYSGRKSEVSGADRLVKHALLALSSPKKAESWRRLCHIWEKHDVRDPHLMDVSYRFVKRGAGEPSRDETLELLQNPGLAVQLILKVKSGVGFLERAVSAVVADGSAYQAIVPLLVRMTRQYPQVLEVEGLSHESRQRLERWLWLDEFVGQPSLDTHRLEELDQVLTEVVPRGYRPQVVSQLISPLAQALYGRARTGETVATLVAMLQRLGHHYPGGKASLFCKFVEAYPDSSGTYWRSKELTHALAFVGCSEHVSTDFSRNMLPQIKRIARLTKRHGGREGYRALSRKTTRWPKTARRRWERAARSGWFYVLPVFLSLVLVVISAVLLHTLAVVKIEPLELLHVNYGALRSSSGGEEKDKDTEKHGERALHRGRGVDRRATKADLVRRLIPSEQRARDISRDLLAAHAPDSVWPRATSVPSLTGRIPP